MGGKGDGEKFDPYKVLTEKVLDMLATGIVPWRQPWTSVGVPANLEYRKPYRGANVLLLSMQPYAQPWWLTARQLRARDGSVRDGEKPTRIFFWKKLTVKDGTSKTGTKQVPMLKLFSVYNVQQCTGIEVPELPEPPGEFEAIEACEAIVAGMPSPPSIRHDGRAAFYNLVTDAVTMPERERFDTSARYYGALFHELTHSTGHERRVGRKGLGTRFGCEQYAGEELVGELGAAMLGGMAGIAPELIDNSASYIAGWMTALRGDPRLLVTAGSAAQRAVDYITNVQFENKKE